MKKMIVYIMIAAMCLSLCACTNSCGKQGFIPVPAQTLAEVTPLPTTTPAPGSSPLAAPAIADGFGPENFSVPGSSSVPGEAAAQLPQLAPINPSPEPTPAPTPVPTPVPTPAPTPAAARVYATKSPTDEYIVEGGSAQFVARAENDTGITWFLATPDASRCISIQEAPGYFYGLTIQGYNSDVLTLSNIPLAMSGYKIQARYDGFGGPVHTNMATIWVVTLKEAIASGYYNPGYTTPTLGSPDYSWSP